MSLDLVYRWCRRCPPPSSPCPAFFKQYFLKQCPFKRCTPPVSGGRIPLVSATVEQIRCGASCVWTMRELEKRYRSTYNTNNKVILFCLCPTSVYVWCSCHQGTGVTVQTLAPLLGSELRTLTDDICLFVNSLVQILLGCANEEAVRSVYLPDR